jgi:hypothetical protein
MVLSAVLELDGFLSKFLLLSLALINANEV